jgi:FMN phosphatase YigB (HAD superfamily)
LFTNPQLQFQLYSEYSLESLKGAQELHSHSTVVTAIRAEDYKASMTSLQDKESIIDNVIFDLGDVLFTWSAESSKSPLSQTIVKKMLRSAKWFDYERGSICEAEAYAGATAEFDVSVEDVASAFQIARISLRSNQVVLQMVHKLRESGKRIFAMSNISGPDWEVIKAKLSAEQWALFDRVFTL